MKETRHKLSNIVILHLYKISRIGKFVEGEEAENRLLFVGGLEGREE